MSAQRTLADRIAENGSPMPFTQDARHLSMTGQEAADYMAQQKQAEANTIWGKIADLFGAGNQAEADYYRSLSDRYYEQQATQSARAWDEYMASTQYQRAVADLKAAGLNPWLVLHNGVGTSYQTTAGSGSSARYKSTNKDSKAGTVIAALMIAVARVASALIAA